MKNLQFSLSQCLRHAFMSGAGYTDLDKISDADMKRWTEYEPPNVGSFDRINKAIEDAELASD